MSPIAAPTACLPVVSARRDRRRDWQDAVMPNPPDPVHWIDPSGKQVGPEPWETVQARVAGGQIPASTPVWWDGQADWQPFAQVDGGSTPGAPVAPAAPATAHQHASEALMDGLTDQELDDEFVALVGRSWELYKETEHATTIDEVALGGIITALVDCGFVLIDLETAGATAAPVATTTTTTTTTAGATSTTSDTIGVEDHQLRFEEPSTGARVLVAMEHLTPDLATAKVMGHRAAVIVGYGERVPDFGRVGQAIRQEVASSFVMSPEPGTVTFDADLSSGYVYAQVDLLLELDRYVSESMEVDHALLRRHLAAAVYTMRMFVRSRFGS
jgi:hypothetical protein